MTILIFRVHVNLKSVLIFYLIQQLKIFFKLPKSVWKATPGHEGRAMPPACPLATALLNLEESWKLLKNFHKN